MRKGDIVWLLGLVTVILFIVLPNTHIFFFSMTQKHPYVMGFLKFSLLATMGELLAIRIAENAWKRPAGFLGRVIVWGLLGMLITLMFEVFAGGITSLLSKGLLPGRNSRLASAFFTSLIMNFTFAPTFMAFHRITDTYWELAYGKHYNGLTLRTVINSIDWENFISFVVLRTIPLFWVPAHTITFLLPTEYRVLLAAFLSIALGAILSMAKKISSSIN